MTETNVYRLPPLGQHTGDVTAGCACASAMFSVKNHKPKRNDKHEYDGCNNVDIYVSSTGKKTHKFLCHQRLTDQLPQVNGSPQPWRPKSRLEMALQASKCIGRGISAFIHFVFPRINFGVGVNLWRWGL